MLCCMPTPPQDKLGTITEHRVRGEDLTVEIKGRRDKQARLAMVLKGREGREEFGAASKRKKSKQGGLSNRCVVGSRLRDVGIIAAGHTGRRKSARRCLWVPKRRRYASAMVARGVARTSSRGAWCTAFAQRREARGVDVLGICTLFLYLSYSLATDYRRRPSQPYGEWHREWCVNCCQSPSISDVAHALRAAACAGCAQHVCGSSL